MPTIAEQWIEEGVEIGMKEGIEEGKREMVMNLLKAGLPISTITKASGFSAQEINRMKNNPPRTAATI
ncbi:MAG: hypothetical protein GY757_46195 [bacterium]|nr:hypothetical protein [bacterium]